jgi:DNA-binding response OmpR family regulator
VLPRFAAYDALVKPLRVLIVEDDEAIGRTLETVLAERGYEVVRAVDGRSALVAADTDRPDLVLLDIGLPDMDGVEVCRRLRRAAPRLLIVMLTARDAEMDVVLGLNAGADDYVVKPFRLAELLARMGAHVRRTQGAGQPGGVLEAGDLQIDVAARVARREFDLLLLLAQSAGRVLTRERLLAELWRDHWGGASKTLDMHVSTLRRKLGEPALITTLRGVGYRFDVP